MKEDEGGEGDVYVHTADELNMSILSTYRDKRGFHIDVGPLEVDDDNNCDCSGHDETCRIFLD